jgi:restriction system protein
VAVQVKSPDAPLDVKVLRELLCRTLVPTRDYWFPGGYRASVLREAARLFFQIRLWDADDLVRMVQRYYEQLSDDFQAELPLKRIWTLVPGED